MDAYLDHTTAAPLIAALGLSRLAELDDATLDQLLLRASIAVDSAARWQGRKLDPSQERAFPRVPSAGAISAEALGAGVPSDVLVAVVYQANDLADPARQAALQKRLDGLTSKSVGSLSEGYAQPGSGTEVAWQALCQPAQALLAKYRLSSGRIL